MDTAASVIVPVKDRRSMLAELLDALDGQTFRDFEVIVVDDGSTDGSGDLARERTVAGKPVRVLVGASRGAVAARRQAVEVAIGGILAFTDSDCVPAPEWLERGVAAIDEGADIVNGFTRPARPLRPFERSVASGLEGLFPTCNMFFRRDLYDRLGGFDETAGERWRFRVTAHAKGTGFGEDTLLGWQAVRSGAALRYAPDAVVEHQVFPPDAWDTVNRVTQTAAFPAMTKEIPELRGTLLWQGVFLGRSARPAVYGLVAGLVLRQRWAAKLALLGWAGWHLREMRRSSVPTRELLQWLPALMAVDAANAAALVAGSLRARSLVL